VKFRSDPTIDATAFTNSGMTKVAFGGEVKKFTASLTIAPQVTTLEFDNWSTTVDQANTFTGLSVIRLTQCDRVDAMFCTNWPGVTTGDVKAHVPQGLSLPWCVRSSEVDSDLPPCAGGRAIATWRPEHVNTIAVCAALAMLVAAVTVIVLRARGKNVPVRTLNVV
jgi:hypothetical protein